MAVQRRHEVPRGRGPMRDGFLREGFGLGWSKLWSNFRHWARQSQHPQKRAAGTALSQNRGVSPRMRKVALQEARIAVNTHPHRRHGQATFDYAKVNMLFSSADAAVQSRASTLGTRQVVSLEVAKFRTRSLPPERRIDVLAVAVGSNIQCGSRKCLWSIEFRC